MCTWGTSVQMEVTIPAHLSSTGAEKRKVIGVDACIAPLVKALNDVGMTTVASCCGHGQGHGNIALADGREMVIVPDYETGRRVDAFLCPAGREFRSQSTPGALVDLKELRDRARALKDGAA